MEDNPWSANSAKVVYVPEIDNLKLTASRGLPTRYLSPAAVQHLPTFVKPIHIIISSHCRDWSAKMIIVAILVTIC
jgi:hypothetical protein